MRKLIASVAALIMCLSISVILLYADPGSATTSDGSTIVTDQSYPPAPDGYIGIWPPDWMTGLDGDDPEDTLTDTTGTGGPDPWSDPHQ